MLLNFTKAKLEKKKKKKRIKELKKEKQEKLHSKSVIKDCFFLKITSKLVLLEARKFFLEIFDPVKPLQSN